MPHCVLEHHADMTFNEKKVLSGVIDLMSRTELFGLPDIKARSIGYVHSVVGDGFGDNKFAHLTISILEGRPEDKLVELGNDLFQFLKHQFPEVSAITVRIENMSKVTYFK